MQERSMQRSVEIAKGDISFIFRHYRASATLPMVSEARFIWSFLRVRKKKSNHSSIICYYTNILFWLLHSMLEMMKRVTQLKANCTITCHAHQGKCMALSSLKWEYIIARGEQIFIITGMSHFRNIDKIAMRYKGLSVTKINNVFLS